MSVNFLVKLRDAAQMIADATNEELEGHAPTESKKWNIEKIQWEKAEGARGPYEKAHSQENADYMAAIEDLQTHSGKLTKNGFFVWLFSDNETIGRKLSKKK